jgi:hypothetical protein
VSCALCDPLINALGLAQASTLYMAYYTWQCMKALPRHKGYSNNIDMWLLEICRNLTTTTWSSFNSQGCVYISSVQQARRTTLMS